jgi:murein L,D-transpeptidase YcbB/YkuD
MAATKAAASVVNAPKPAPAPKPVAAPAPRAKVKATAANTKDYDKTVALQKKLGVTADGIMGPQTRAAMAAAAAKKPATPASQVTPTAGDPGMQQSASPAPTGTARKVSTVAPGAKPAAADDMMSPDDMMMQPARVAKSNAALAGDVEKAKKAGSGILDKIGAGISSLFKPSERSVIGRRQAAAQAAPAAGSNAAGSNFATAADGSISRTDNPRQPGDAAPTTRTAAATDAAPTRRSDTSFRASDGTNTVARDASGNLNVRQRVTDPDAKAALLSKVNRAREMQRLALAAGSTDPDDIRAYQRRMANTKGTGAAGGTDMNTF